MIRRRSLLKRREKDREGSTTVEMALIFPVCFLSVILVLQAAMAGAFRLYTYSLARRAVLVYQQERRDGWEKEEALSAARVYLQRKARSVPLTLEIDMDAASTFLSEKVRVRIGASFGLIGSSSWEDMIEESVVDPVGFRNGVDLVVEVIKTVKDELTEWGPSP